MYAKTLYAGWADMDFNSHMKNTAYLDKAADVRQMFLIEHGFPMEEFLRLRIGPVVRKDEVEYFNEVGLQQQITVTYALAGHAADGSRFLLRHEIFRADGKLSARVTSAGGWLNLAERKLMAPPRALLSAMNSLEKTDDFIVLPSSIKPRLT
ncbi:thioesterase family protein [Luteimonas salinilitoris]|uniref:Thioesterase family protein n=1 Tax=Luteimonas salinilitoris TaxID=3237697 RepID=A0ABV4HPG9_9GAMM